MTAQAVTSLFITSPGPGEGKTAVAVALIRLLNLKGYRRLGDGEPADGRFISLALGVSDGDPTIVEGEPPDADGPVLAVVAYRGMRTADAVDAIGPASVGLILNAVPEAQRRLVEREIRPALEAKGYRVVGVLPEERWLRAGTVGELVTFLDGEVLTAPDALESPVESYMVGAMAHVSAIPYFNRKQNKAVICGGQRIDLHMAALGTPCQCIIVTGGYDPDPVVLERAEAEGVPIVKVYPEAVATLDRVSQFLREVRFRQPAKIEPFVDLFRRHVELGPIERVLGRAGATVGA